MTEERRRKVLVLARNYPNNVLPTLGLWTQRLVLASTRSADPTVISPVPYAPPLLPVEAFAKIDPRKSQVVELRFFGGLDVKETAAVLKVSNETVMRDWKLAKVWLLRDLSGAKQHGS